MSLNKPKVNILLTTDMIVLFGLLCFDLNFWIVSMMQSFLSIIYIMSLIFHGKLWKKVNLLKLLQKVFVFFMTTSKCIFYFFFLRKSIQELDTWKQPCRFKTDINILFEGWREINWGLVSNLIYRKEKI